VAPAHARGCARTPPGLSSVPAPSTEVVVVVTARRASTTGRLSTYQRRDGCWTESLGPFLAYVGARGLSRTKHEGDGTTPEGLFALGSLAYGIAPRVTRTLRYHHLVCGDWWDEQSGTPDYNRFVHVACGARPPFGGDSEALWLATPYYDSFVVIEYNTAPVRPGRGSAIFLHDSTGAPTTGCVSVAAGHLDAVLRWLEPHERPVIVIATAGDLAQY